jgi:ferric-dicitrate binding protein FerR (iron transport regulator)
MIIRYLTFLALLPLAGFVFVSCSENRIVTGDNFEVVEFPDGSVAFINQNSEVSYAPGFDPRNVEVRGEVYFVVEAGETPFVVTGDMGKVTALGTAFDVRSSADEMVVEVEKGSVELNANQMVKKVSRGEKAAHKKGDRDIVVGRSAMEFKRWIKELRREFKKLGREIKHNAQDIGEESREVGKELDKELKELVR